MSVTSISPVSKEALAVIESSLQEQQYELQRAIQKAEKEIRALHGSGRRDAVDDSCDNAPKESLFASYSRNRTRLRKIELALKRICTSDFGVCVDCGGVIGSKRLQAMPWASNCIECQKKSE